jgi:hypothetical protein
MEHAVFNFMRILLLVLETTKLRAQEIHFDFYKIIEIIQSAPQVSIFTIFTDFVFTSHIIVNYYIHLIRKMARDKNQKTKFY